MADAARIGWSGRPARVATGLAARLVAGASLVLLVIVLADGSHPGPWPLPLVIPLGIGFDACCLRDIVRAAEVRDLRTWAWALICLAQLLCLAQLPLGGILCLTIGRMVPARPAPPS